MISLPLDIKCFHFPLKLEKNGLTKRYRMMSFVNILYGQNQHLLVNSNCCIGNLIHWIKARSNTERNVGIDLADKDGFLQDLTSFRETSYALDVLKNRKDYILVQIERDAKLRLTITPLLHNVEHFYPQLIEKLREEARARSPITNNNNNENHSNNSSRPDSRRSSNGALVNISKTRSSLSSVTKVVMTVNNMSRTNTNSPNGSLSSQKLNRQGRKMNKKSPKLR